MPSIINSDDGVVSGSSGLKTTGANDGILALQNNGTTNVTVNATGSVGIGTTSPNYKLHVANSSATSTTLLANILARLQSNASGADASLQFSDNVTNSAGISLNQGNMTFSIAGSSAAQIDTSANFRFNSGYGSVATAYGCRAWVNFNGTGVVAIQASGNVSSITDNGTGDYTVNFTTAMPDANYATLATGVQNSSASTTNRSIGVYVATAGTETSTSVLAGSVRVLIMASSSTKVDQSPVNVAIFR